MHALVRNALDRDAVENPSSADTRAVRSYFLIPLLVFDGANFNLEPTLLVYSVRILYENVVPEVAKV